MFQVLSQFVSVNVMEIMIKEVLDINLEGVTAGPLKYGAFDIFIPFHLVSN